MPKKYYSGFSLIELMTTVAIASILLTLAVPSFQSFLRDTQVTSALTSLHSALLFARNEAISREQDITICASSTPGTCGGDWNQGWSVGIPNNAGVMPAASLFKVENTLSADITITGPANNRLVFQRNGTSTIGMTGFTVRRTDGQGNARTIAINTLGKARINPP